VTGCGVIEHPTGLGHKASVSVSVSDSDLPLKGLSN
jgi:hypothetical protein